MQRECRGIAGRMKLGEYQKPLRSDRMEWEGLPTWASVLPSKVGIGLRNSAIIIGFTTNITCPTISAVNNVRYTKNITQNSQLIVSAINAVHWDNDLTLIPHDCHTRIYAKIIVHFTNLFSYYNDGCIRRTVTHGCRISATLCNIYVIIMATIIND